ncbi:MAG: bifunctional 2-C-methyl-D-erythritol 4-phosphate cytidylyltransferase/2-C-methyl-D-erythritol 2,4-cyclodiphosphate synthase [Alphaproteobacteria bacterium]
MAGTYALIVAAGRGTRFGDAVPKQYQIIAGRALLAHGARSFVDHSEIAGVRVVIHPDDRPRYDAAMSGLPLLEPVAGGPTRQESTRLGLESLVPVAPDRVLVHDGARPLVRPALIDGVLAALDDAVGAVPALPVTDALKRDTGGRSVAESVDRSGLWRAQTPQGFRFAELLGAHRAHAGGDWPDDAAIVQAAGHAVALVLGDEDNVKVTGPEDLGRVARLMTVVETRVGFGFDVHRFGPGDHVMIGGVRVGHDHGLVGHSDADVALHAVVDALLGALGAGDLGQHFPPSDVHWRGADSALFVAEARRLIEAAGAEVGNVDLTVIGERPRIGPHRDAIRGRIAGLLGIEPGRVNVKATTTERLGFAGREEGLAAQAAATLAYRRLP